MSAPNKEDIARILARHEKHCITNNPRLKPADAEIIGELDDCRTATSDFRVAPFVAVIPYPYRFQTSKREVKELLEVPLSVFLDPAGFESRAVADSVHDGREFFVNYKGHIIWGATARML